MSYVAVGRKYGVSGNAVRKWLRWYEYEREMQNRTQAKANDGPEPGTIAA